MEHTIAVGDCRSILAQLDADSIHTCVTSPPYYGQRDYGHAAQIGLEQTPDEYVRELVAVFREVRRVLRPDGTLWLNLGDSYASNWGMGAIGRKSSWCSTRSDDLEGKGWGTVENAIRPNSFKPGRPDGIKVKDLIGTPWAVAFALRMDGWYLRQEIIWSKPDGREIGAAALRQRCARTHEHIFLLSKKQTYYFDHAAIMEPGLTGNPRSRRSVWEVRTAKYAGAHFATFPEPLIEPCILAGCPAAGTVLDPFAGSGTTGAVAARLGRKAMLIELNPDYADLARQRLCLAGHPDQGL